jgi:hypothetical protein
VQGHSVPTQPASPAGQSGAVLIRPSAIHGLGGFAARDLPQGARIIEYLGAKITKAESLRRCAENNQFIFALDETFDLDGDVPWNPARFLNHSCAPNCDAELIEGRLWIVARREIRAGEELTFNYGYDLESYRDHPCNCGAPDCAGYIVAEEFFATLRRKLPPRHQAAGHARPPRATFSSQNPRRR